MLFNKRRLVGIITLFCFIASINVAFKAVLSFNQSAAPIESVRKQVETTTHLTTGSVKDASNKDADRPHNFQRPNQLITNYDQYVAAKVRELADRKAPANDTELVNLARQMIDHPHTRYPKLSKGPRFTVHLDDLDRILGQMEGGTFIECGAYDGESDSTTIFLEARRGWTGLLVEADPGYYTQMLGKQRNVYSINACLSPHPYFVQVKYKFSDDDHLGGELGHIDTISIDAKTPKDNIIPCFPTETLLLALNWTTVDFFTLDVEGQELPILRTIPWTKLNIRTVAAEYVHSKEGGHAYVAYMKDQGYRMAKMYDIYNATHHVRDYLFARN